MQRHRSTVAAPVRRFMFVISLACAFTVGSAAWFSGPQFPSRVDAAMFPAGRFDVAVLPPAVVHVQTALSVETAGQPAAAVDRDAPAASSEALPPADAADYAMAETIEVRKGDTLIDLLVEAGIDHGEAIAAIDALEDVFAPRELKPGQEITINLNLAARVPEDSLDVQLAGLSLQPSVERDVLVRRSDEGAFIAEAVDRPLTHRTVLGAGAIESSLFEAGQDAAVPVEILSRVIKAFSYDVDFQREIQPGDRFAIVYERFEDEDGRLARTGDVRYASLTVSGELKEIFRFEPADGVADFFNAKGESVRKALLRTPLDVIRITSKFGMRKHPILGYSKMHKGIDFAASSGTPIFAAGDGKLLKIGRAGGYGNYIQIRHNSQYATAYAHMSRFAKGLKQRSKVRQGDVIGYVGTTGNSTGSHLHYEVLVNGKQINPMNVKLTGRKLDGKDLERFQAAMADINALRRSLGEAVLMAKGERRCTPDQTEPCDAASDTAGQ